MKRYFPLVLLFFGAICGTLIAWHWDSDNLASSDFPADEIIAMEGLFADYTEEQSFLQNRIETLRGLISEEQLKVEEQITESNIELLDEMKKGIGLNERNGNGVLIQLDDGKMAIREQGDNLNLHLVQASDIRDIINVLNSARVEAIAVNGKRIIANSTINSVGTNIMVNNSNVAPPFEIMAIGDIDLILPRLKDRSQLPSLYDRVLSNNVRLSIEIKGEIKIAPYSGDLKSELITLVE